jgi:hypothetical protein
MFNLFRLLGSLESLKYHLPVDIFSVQVDQVKRLKKQIVTAKKVIKPLVYKKFRG